MGNFNPDTMKNQKSCNIDGRRNGVHLSYDRMASVLAAYENAEVSKVPRELEG